MSALRSSAITARDRTSASSRPTAASSARNSAIAAAHRGLTIEQLVIVLLSIVVSDGLLDAVLDDAAMLQPGKGEQAAAV